MPTTVTMLQSRRGEDGIPWLAGQSYSASDAFAAFLITYNYATGTLPIDRDLVPIMGQTNSAGQVTSLVLPDGITYPLVQSGGGSIPMILAGDSRTAQNFATATVDFVSGLVMKWAGLGNAALGSPFRLINGGVSGDITAQILARLPALLTANPGAGWLVIRGMVNDMQSGNLVASGATGNQVTKEMIVANLSAMISLGLGAGKKIAICTEVGSIAPFVSPVNASTAYGALQRQAFGYVNHWIRTTCATNGYRLIDMEYAHNDPATGIAPTNHYVSDGVHFSYIGSCPEARAFAATFADFAAPSRSPFGRFDPSNLLGPVAGGAGAVTADAANDTRIITLTAPSGIPSGWSISRFDSNARGGGVGSKVARTDYAQGTVAQLALTSSGTFGGAGFWIGGDATNVLARWDRAWTDIGASTACAVGRRVNANGCSYVCVTAGTTGGSDPSAGWSTQPGTFITDGTAVFMCQRKPLSGERVQFVVEVEFDSLVGNATPLAFGYFRDTAGVNQIVVYGQPDVTGANGIAGNWLPARAMLVFDPLTLPNSNIRYLAIQIGLYGESGSTCNMRVLSASCVNLDA